MRPQSQGAYCYLEDHDAFRDTVRRFLDAVAVPTAPQWATSGIPATVLTAAGDYGLLSVTLPEEHGGAGSDDLRFGAVVLEEAMSLGLAGFALTVVLGSLVVGPLLVRHAPADVQRTWLPGLATGTLRVAVVGLDAAHHVRLRIEEGQARLFGTVPGVVAAAEADLLLVVARDETDLERLVLLEAALAEVVTEGDRLAIPGAASAVVLLDGIALPLASILEGDGSRQVDELRADQDLWCAVMALAGAEQAQRLTLAYVKERQVFGKPLSTFENSQVALAEVQVLVDSARALVEQALLIRHHEVGIPARVATALLMAVRAHKSAVDQGVQLHGGYGYMREYPISQAFSDAAALRALATPGTTRQQLLADSLGLSRAG